MFRNEVTGLNFEILKGILIPFFGTSLGAACVFFLKKDLNSRLETLLNGFAAGVMGAASIWSLLLPAIDRSAYLGNLAFLPAACGFLAGTVLLLLFDHALARFHPLAAEKTSLMLFTITLHNIPEGMAVGAIYAGWLMGNGAVTLTGALALSLGIAIQNFPEGAVVSLPLRAAGFPRRKAFVGGVLSGAVEPAAAVLTIFLSEQITPILPFLLSFAAGAMIYVVVVELIPELNEHGHSDLGTLFFSFGFVIMMILDVALS